MNITADGFCDHCSGIPDAKLEVAFTGIMENMEKIVFSKMLSGSDWKNTRLVKELKKQEISEMKKKGGDFIVFGSPGLASQLMEMDLVDDCYFLVHPFISGGGPHLFEKEKLKTKKELAFKSAESFQSVLLF